MKKVFTENGWQDYLFWQNEDKKTLKNDFLWNFFVKLCKELSNK